MADESGLSTVTCKLDNFSEYKEVSAIISSIPEATKSLVQTEGDLERLTVILDRYQEQPHLLDPHLDCFISKLLSIIQNEDATSKIATQAFKYLYLITKVRGSKYIVRLFPHEVEHVEMVLTMLGKQNLNDHNCWENRYILLLWLSIVCMVPFDMVKFDGNLNTDEKPIIERILDVAKSYLNVFDKSRDAAALVIAKFVTRPDVKSEHLPKFLNWTLDILHQSDASTLHGTIILTGVLTTLALLFKHGKRADLISFAAQVQQVVDSCELTSVNNNLLRKLNIKLIQRLGMTFLKPRIASWRYQRGTRSLSYNLANPHQTTSNHQNTTTDSDITKDDNHDDFEIPEDIEDIIERLLNGLKDKDTIVRWSAAKGVGRITGRLPKDFADEIVAAVLELCSFLETDSAWHGACLALAELGRRGLLLPQRLTQVVPVVLKALQYDERRAAISVGSNVRDAACYVCWSFARAYEPIEIKPYVNDIACGLLITALFDREINCRRAASAAFQENVGRQGYFPYGIDISTTADYFSVGKRSNTFLEISVYIAQYKEYCRPLIDHLYKIKRNHWDIAIRELVSKALFNLTTRDAEYMGNQVLCDILPECVGVDLITKHGSILCAAEIYHALLSYSQQHNRVIKDFISDTCLEQLEEIISKLTEAKLFRGIGGELMRPAVCHLIEKLSLSKFQCYNEATLDIWQQTIDDNLSYQQLDERSIQVKAVSALRAFTDCYRQKHGIVLPNIQEPLITKYIEKLNSPLEKEREGFILALGSLPQFMLKNYLMKILDSLLTVIKLPKQDAGKYAQTRADALNSLAKIANTVGLQDDGDGNQVVNQSSLTNLYHACFTALSDYTTDSRGDVGAWVREASMSCLFLLTKLVIDVDSSLLQPDICSQMINCLLKQASEKIDRTRAHAGEIFLKILHLKNPRVPHIPEYKRLCEIFPSDGDDMNWSAPAKCFPKIAELLQVPCYQYSVLSGLVLSVGGLTESLIRQSGLAFRTFLGKIANNDDALMEFVRNLIRIFEESQKVDRVMLPLFNVLDLLLSNGNLYFLASNERSNLTEKICDLTKYEITKISDARKIISSVNVFCGLLQFAGDTRRKCLQTLLMFLCHKYPRVRKTTADSFYTAIITYEDVVNEENLDEVMTILCETVWEESVDKIREQRNKLSDIFKIARPVIKKSSKLKDGPSISEQKDTFSSYKDLVSRTDY